MPRQEALARATAVGGKLHGYMQVGPEAVHVAMVGDLGSRNPPVAICVDDRSLER